MAAKCFYITKKKRAKDGIEVKKCSLMTCLLKKWCNFIIHANLYAYIFFVLECRVTGDVMKLNLLASGIFVVCFLFKNPQH